MIPAAWADLPFFRDDWPRVRDRLAAESGPVYPPTDRIFAALDLCAPDDVRVVILGQDPYHTPGKADGLAFSIPQGFPGRLDSLGNIFKELQDDLGVTRTRTELDDWARQGVLLLNTALSVPEGRPKKTVSAMEPRPSSRSTSAKVRWSRPAPPTSSGMLQPKKPRSLTFCASSLPISSGT